MSAVSESVYISVRSQQASKDLEWEASQRSTKTERNREEKREREREINEKETEPTREANIRTVLYFNAIEFEILFFLLFFRICICACVKLDTDKSPVFWALFCVDIQFFFLLLSVVFFFFFIFTSLPMKNEHTFSTLKCRATEMSIPHMSAIRARIIITT